MQTLYYYTKNYIRFINIYFIKINLKIYVLLVKTSIVVRLLRQICLVVIF